VRRKRRPAAAGRLRTILCTTDLSARADRAFLRAIELAVRHGAKLAVLHVVDGELPAAMAARNREDATEAIRYQIENVPGAASLRTIVRVELGDPYEAILRCARQIEADLLVFGMHRTRPLADLFIGTTTERVTRLGGRPVLVVRDSVRGPYRRAVAAVDFSPASRHATEFARRLAPDAYLQLVHAHHTPFAGLIGSAADRRNEMEGHERGLAALLQQQMSMAAGKSAKGALLPPIVKAGAVPDVVLNETRRAKAELLVLGTHGRSAVAQAILGSIAAGFLNRPPCDVLAVPVR
jgi:nucleotide-binding universal stress UspA family protein